MGLKQFLREQRQPQGLKVKVTFMLASVSDRVFVISDLPQQLSLSQFRQLIQASFPSERVDFYEFFCDINERISIIHDEALINRSVFAVQHPNALRWRQFVELIEPYIKTDFED